METLHAPSELALEELNVTLNPYRTPDKFVPMLARWLDLDWVFDGGGHGKPPNTISSELISSGLGRVRELIGMAATLSQWRGTGKGLIRFLETATGVHGFTIQEQVLDPDGVPKPFHLSIRAPWEARDFKALVIRIIEAEKPAYVTYDLEIEAEKPKKNDV